METMDIPLDSPGENRRGKSLEQSDAHLSYSTLQCKLGKILKDEFGEDIHRLLNRCATNITRIAFEAYLLAEMHCLHELDAGRSIPPINQSFFNSCCVLVSDTKEEVRDEALSVTFRDHYQPQRPSSLTVPFNKYMSSMMATLAKEMDTMTTSHIALNFNQRLLRYVCVRYSLSKTEAMQFIRGAFVEPEASLVDDQKTFKAWLVHDPESTIKMHKEHFLTKLHDIQVYYDSLAPETKGVRHFTLLPKKRGFIGSFALIDESTLPMILKLLDRQVQERIVTRLCDQFNDDEEAHGYLTNRLSCEALFPSDFAQNETISHALWRLLFDVTKFETSNRKFSYKISTDGCAVTVYLQKPKSGSAFAAEEEFDPMPRNLTEYKSFIGIDPGRTFVATAFDGERTVQVSSKEIRHDSKTTQREDWEKNFREREPEYANAIAQLPSLKTGSFSEFKDRVRRTLEQAELLFSICERMVFRQWRFKLSRFSKIAYAKAAKKIIGDHDRVLVGFGDWSQQDGAQKAQRRRV